LNKPLNKTLKNTHKIIESGLDKRVKGTLTMPSPFVALRHFPHTVGEFPLSLRGVALLDIEILNYIIFGFRLKNILYFLPRKPFLSKL